MLQPVWVLQSHRVLHQHDMHSVNFAHFDGEDAKDFAQEAAWSFLVMRREAWLYFEKEIELSFVHCLDDELAIMAEEEEAPRSTSPLPCFEHHVSIELRTQTGVQAVCAGQVLRERVDEG